MGDGERGDRNRGWKQWWWPWSRRRARSLNAVVQTRVVTGGPHQFDLLSGFSKTAWNWEFKIDVFHCSKKNQILCEDRLEYSEQVAQLCGLLIPNRINVINLGTESNLNVLWILKGYKPSRKNLRNSPKISLELVFTKVKLVQHTCMQEIWVTTQVLNNLVWIKRK
jgi:hypothetical protein